MRSLLQLSLILISSSILFGCTVYRPFNFYEGPEQPSEEVALVNFCGGFLRPFQNKRQITIDGKDILSEGQLHASKFGVVPCRARIIPGEHHVYYYARGDSDCPPSSFHDVVDFKAGKTYYFLYNVKGVSTRHSWTWLEDEQGNVVAGAKYKHGRWFGED